MGSQVHHFARGFLKLLLFLTPTSKHKQQLLSLPSHHINGSALLPTNLPIQGASTLFLDYCKRLLVTLSTQHPEWILKRKKKNQMMSFKNPPMTSCHTYNKVLKIQHLTHCTWSVTLSLVDVFQLPQLPFPQMCPASLPQDSCTRGLLLV